MTMIANNTTWSLSAKDDIMQSSYFIILSIQGCTIILVNLLTIITFTINRHLRKRSMYCVINLAVADMLLGIGELTLIAQTFVDYDLLFLFLTTVAGALLSLALVAVERMCATVWPVRHRNARPWTYTQAISMTWLSASVNGLLTIVMTRAFNALLLVGLGISLVVVVICVSYLVIFIKVKQQNQQMAGHRSSGPDQRLAMTLFIVTMASFGTWTPVVVDILLIATNVINVPGYVLSIATILAFSNSLINPIIYVFRIKDFRKALLRLLLKCSRDRPTQLVPLRQTNNRQNRRFKITAF